LMPLAISHSIDISFLSYYPLSTLRLLTLNRKMNSKSPQKIWVEIGMIWWTIVSWSRRTTLFWTLDLVGGVVGHLPIYSAVTIPFLDCVFHVVGASY
jgi:hypothetical protein